jgi:hypothetical protein
MLSVTATSTTETHEKEGEASNQENQNKTTMPSLLSGRETAERGCWVV